MCGIIPACAGNTVPRSVFSYSIRDHPRMRGEHGFLFSLCSLLRWIIPACAGNTESTLCGVHSARDHPRMRGEHIPPLPRRRIRVGSSPHARGTRLRRLRRSSPPGIIPACAGNTWWVCRRRGCGWDHPRMRGEHKSQVMHISGGQGSSPHARGTRPELHVRAAIHGIIPACAGNTEDPRLAARQSGDHPRMRGEHRLDIEPASVT